MWCFWSTSQSELVTSQELDSPAWLEPPETQLELTRCLRGQRDEFYWAPTLCQAHYTCHIILSLQPSFWQLFSQRTHFAKVIQLGRGRVWKQDSVCDLNGTQCEAGIWFQSVQGSKVRIQFMTRLGLCIESKSKCISCSGSRVVHAANSQEFAVLRLSLGLTMCLAIPLTMPELVLPRPFCGSKWPALLGNNVPACLEGQLLWRWGL